MKEEGEKLKAMSALTIQEIMDGAGLTMEKAVLELKELISQNDNQTAKLSGIKAAIELHQFGQIRKANGAISLQLNNNQQISAPPSAPALPAAAAQMTAPRFNPNIVDAVSVDVTDEKPKAEPVDTLAAAFEESRSKLTALQENMSLHSGG